MSQTVEPLPFNYDALEPYFDKETMMIHHDKHHQTYFTNFLKAIAGTELEGKDVREILSNLDQVPAEIKQAVINHGGGYFHHSFFWNILKKDVAFEGEIADEIVTKWGSLDNFKEEFSKASATVFGSGWAWLVYDKENKELEIIKTANQDSPISIGKEPLLCLDVWEHSYYIKFQNRRPEYIEAFFNVINWQKVNKHFLEAKGGA